MTKFWDWLKENFDRGDIQFFLGLAILFYGFFLRDISLACIVSGAILMSPSYAGVMARILASLRKPGNVK